MFKRKLIIYIVHVFLLTSFIIKTMVFDNRYIPLLARPQKLIGGRLSSFSANLLFATASSAFDAQEEEIGIPEIFGNLDLGQLNNAFTAAGLTSPLRSEWRGGKIPWRVDGKLQIQGGYFSWNQHLIGPLSAGCSWVFLRANTRNAYELKIQEVNFSLGPSDVLELDETRREMFTDLGITNNHTTQIGFGDIDAYIRVGGNWDYTLKCRLLNVGLRGGLLVPTGQSTSRASASSIPFGGNGHWGFYFAADGLFEVKEDVKVGFYTRLSKRLRKTCIRRMPSCQGEPSLYGVVQGAAQVSPGVTLVFSPFFILENVRKGLGLGVQFTWTSHQQDTWKDRRSLAEREMVPVDLRELEKRSSWRTAYATLNVFYDFGRVRPERGFDPVINFYWDVPAMLFTPKRSAKTHKITLGVSFPF